MLKFNILRTRFDCYYMRNVLLVVNCEPIFSNLRFLFFRLFQSSQFVCLSNPAKAPTLRRLCNRANAENVFFGGPSLLNSIFLPQNAIISELLTHCIRTFGRIELYFLERGLIIDVKELQDSNPCPLNHESFTLPLELCLEEL